MDKYILKNNSNKVINLPPEIWKDAGWKINEEVTIAICENYNIKDEKWLSVSIEHTKDINKWDDSVFPVESE